MAGLRERAGPLKVAEFLEVLEMARLLKMAEMVEAAEVVEVVEVVEEEKTTKERRGVGVGIGIVAEGVVVAALRVGRRSLIRAALESEDADRDDDQGGESSDRGISPIGPVRTRCRWQPGAPDLVLFFYSESDEPGSRNRRLRPMLPAVGIIFLLCLPPRSAPFVRGNAMRQPLFLRA